MPRARQELPELLYAGLFSQTRLIKVWYTASSDALITISRLSSPLATTTRGGAAGCEICFR